jgi:branched-chain amino acid aminotransferase
VKIDKNWFPDEPTNIGQLYLRMCHISTDEALGVATPKRSKIFCMMSPMLMKNKRLAVKCSDGVNKNWPLGHGQYTLSGNLGALVPTVQDAKENGFDDVLWLLDENVQELTILNVFFVIQNRYGVK